MLAFAGLLLVSDTERVVRHQGAVEMQQRLSGRQAGGAEHHAAQPGCRQPLQVQLSIEARPLGELRHAADGDDGGGAWLAAIEQSTLSGRRGSVLRKSLSPAQVTLSTCKSGFCRGGGVWSIMHTLASVVNAGSSRAGVLADTKIRTPDPAMNESAYKRA